MNQLAQVADGEKIGVARIRVSLPRLHATAVVGSFFCVDKLLQGWSVRLDGQFDCQFEIAYHDGRTISGVYRYLRKGGKRPSLMGFVRACLQAQGVDPARPCAVHGLGTSHARAPAMFLARYELDDFGQSATSRLA